MANYFTSGTVTPFLPEDAFTTEETEILYEAGFTLMPCNEKGLVYLYCEESCGDEAIDVFEDVLKRLPEKEYPYIYLEAACACSKMRSDGFGGFAWFITRDWTDWMGTGSWIGKKMIAYKKEKKEKEREDERDG